MTPERINIKQFEMNNEKKIIPNYLYIELHDHFIFYAAKYIADVPKSEEKDDHSMGWKTINRNYRTKIKKAQLVSIELYFSDKTSLWVLEIEALGVGASLNLYFQNGKEAKEIYDKIDKYIFS